MTKCNSCIEIIGLRHTYRLSVFIAARDLPDVEAECECGDRPAVVVNGWRVAVQNNKISRAEISTTSRGKRSIL